MRQLPIASVEIAKTRRGALRSSIYCSYLKLSRKCMSIFYLSMFEIAESRKRQEWERQLQSPTSVKTLLGHVKMF
jgi:hypothetical protein